MVLSFLAYAAEARMQHVFLEARRGVRSPRGRTLDARREAPREPPRTQATTGDEGSSPFWRKAKSSLFIKNAKRGRGVVD